MCVGPGRTQVLCSGVDLLRVKRSKEPGKHVKNKSTR